MRVVGSAGFRVAVVSVLGGALVAAGTAVAQADPWDPWIPGIPNLDGPGVNIGVPGNPLPPGQAKKWIDDLVPNFGNGKGKWK